MTDDSGVTEDLRLVRKQLDSLAKTRLMAPLESGLELVYQELCALERELLHTRPVLEPN
jgi:hypothetical protein